MRIEVLKKIGDFNGLTYKIDHVAKLYFTLG